MLCRAIASIALLIAFVGLSVDAQGSTCTAQTGLSQCMTQAQQGQSCDWIASSSLCVQDPCLQYTTVTSCLNNTALGCLPLPWNGIWPTNPTGNQVGPLCVSPGLVCHELSNLQGDCPATKFCTPKTDLGYCGSLIKSEGGTATTNCDLSFPGWSIVLIVIWMLIMCILGFIIFLIVSKGKQQAIKNVERSEVVVDSLHLRDNFNLQQPLTQAP